MKIHIENEPAIREAMAIALVAGVPALQLPIYPGEGRTATPRDGNRKAP